MALPARAVALRREWIADWAQISLSGLNLDAVLLEATEAAELAGLLGAALRLDLPAVIAAPLTNPFAVALSALGFAPLTGDLAEVVVGVARARGPRPRALVESFSLANALRAGLSLGGGPELLVHLAALAREARVIDFGQVIRVLTPESSVIAYPDSPWYRTHGAAGLISCLLDVHDTRAVTGRLRESLPPVPRESPPEVDSTRLVFVRGRASGTEMVCRVSGSTTEVSGECRIFDSEESAVSGMMDAEADPGNLLVVTGCGPRGGPGLLRLDGLGHALQGVGLTESVPVLTDGLPPEGATGLWASLATPEAAVGGIIGRLRDGDALRLDLVEGLIRTGARADDLGRREPLAGRVLSGSDYAARYARTALPALEGAGFG